MGFQSREQFAVQHARKRGHFGAEPFLDYHLALAGLTRVGPPDVRPTDALSSVGKQKLRPSPNREKNIGILLTLIPSFCSTKPYRLVYSFL